MKDYGFGFCKTCEAFVKLNSSTHEYCSSCLEQRLLIQHREDVKKYQKSERGRFKVKLYAREYHKREYDKAKRKAYWSQHKDLQNQLKRESDERHPERKKARDYARIRRKAILARDGNACVACKGKEHLELHHLEYVNDVDKVITLCADCHEWVENGIRDGLPGFR